MSTLTTIYGLKYLVEGQDGSTTRYNDNLEVAAALMRKTIKNRGYTNSTSVASPVDGEVYYIAGTGAGEWAGHDNELAVRVNGGWKFATITSPDVWYVQSNVGVAVNAMQRFDGGTTWTNV